MAEAIIALTTLPREEGLGEALDKLKSRSDVLYAMSLNVHNNTTPLLEAVRVAEGGRYFNAAVVAGMLQFQSKHMQDACFPSFFSAAQGLVSKLSKDDAHFLRKEVADISYRVTKMACSLGLSKAVVGLLLSMADLCSFSANCLISIHVDLLQVFIHAQMYGAALRWLRQRHFFEINLEKSTLTPQEILRFFYYKSICHLAEKDYSKALCASLVVLSLPTSSLSAIAIKALRKARLIALILSHKPLILPKYVSSFVTAHALEKHPAYDDLEARFMAHDIAGLGAAVSRHAGELSLDQNLGLSKQVIRALQDLQLQRLSKAFSTIPIRDVGAAAGIPDLNEVVRWLRGAVKCGVTHAVLEDDFVRFLSPPDAPVSSEEEVQAAFRAMAGFSYQLRCTHIRVQTSAAMVQRQVASSRAYHMSGRAAGGMHSSGASSSGGLLSSLLGSGMSGLSDLAVMDTSP